MGHTARPPFCVSFSHVTTEGLQSTSIFCKNFYLPLGSFLFRKQFAFILHDNKPGKQAANASIKPISFGAGHLEPQVALKTSWQFNQLFTLYCKQTLQPLCYTKRNPFYFIDRRNYHEHPPLRPAHCCPKTNDFYA
ncbi:hypothetical protein [uncultured Allofournierella sp.]|uniref:hypothetical protein n=1 Tax=uncultured Allofournierella sp. TaxID=1940258 RepID=UPI0037522A53